PAVRHNPPESIPPGVLNLPLLDPFSQPAPPIRTHQPRTLNIDRTRLSRVFPVPSQVLLKLHVMNKRRASRHLPVYHNPVRFQAQPVLRGERIPPEYLHIQPPQGRPVLRQHRPPKLKHHPGIHPKCTVSRPSALFSRVSFTTICTSLPSHVRQRNNRRSEIPRNSPRSNREIFGCVSRRTFAASACVSRRCLTISAICLTSCAFTSMSSLPPTPKSL